ncbi:MAG: outer membrane protein assembly factor BamA [Bacteroidota bacterium]|jgi:outer membrane protein insertion porin family
MRKISLVLLLLVIALPYTLRVQAQDTTFQDVPDWIDYAYPKTYILENIVITGTSFYDKTVLQILSGLTIGQKIKIPGEDISKAINNLWKQKMFDDIAIKVFDVDGNKITLELFLKEKPRLSTFAIKGLKKGKANSLREEISLKAGQVITETLLANTRYEIKKFYNEKGFLDADVRFEQEPDDPKRNTARLKINVNLGRKVKISDISFDGNTSLTDSKIRRLFKDTKPKYRFLAKSRFDEDKYQDDKQRIISKYLSLGYRDIAILKDSIYRDEKGFIKIKIDLAEGNKYYFRNIKFTGNSKYTNEDLNSILRIKSGDVYDQSQLDQRLNMNQGGMDISTLYMDDGYLFFSVQPVEVLVENDSIDMEIRIHEGQQARINKVMVSGNSKTSDHVIMRELRTRPGQLFSRSDITRTMQALSQIGYFNPEALNVNPVPHPESGTVDIEYTVEERPNDQIELSAGWGANMVVGTLGLSLNNISVKRFFDRKAWAPIPSGDGQRLSLRAQTNGTFFQSYSASFSEPWLGGKKPISFSTSLFHSIQANGYATGNPLRAALTTTGVTVGIGKRLRFPDDFFTLQYQINFQRYYNEVNERGVSYLPSIPAGAANSFSVRFILSRNSTDQPIYPRSGSNISISAQFTPPYSYFGGEAYLNRPESERSRWLEFHKWKIDATWFSKLVDKLVLVNRINFGMIGRYNSRMAYTPFERFWVGGAGLMGFNLDGRELIALRGYQDNSLTPIEFNAETRSFARQGALIYNRYTTELRYPISLNPSATVFPLIFFEAGSAWSNYKAFNPFEVYRSFGGGVRIFLPMFGLIGLDYGWGLDNVPLQPGVNKGNFHFLIGQQF